MQNTDETGFKEPAPRSALKSNRRRAATDSSIAIGEDPNGDLPPRTRVSQNDPGDHRAASWK
jgi:hypothetical protein